ncbi:MAG: hypothetical protein JWM44_1203 [Bacilli bacterium]|nr:hypothetical protein [Bacilli bacterium]
MGKKNYYNKASETKFEEASNIQGFDIEINKDDASRIDRLVDHYENTILSHLNEEYSRKTTWSNRLADKIASFGGSWRFILFFAAFLLVWIVWNVLPFTYHFDVTPFILLNLCLSFVASFQAPIIMMSQNRQAVREKHESIIDFAINYKSEQEIDDMQSHLHRIEGELLEVKKLILALSKTEI